jgi:uncharacterized membrane protein
MALSVLRSEGRTHGRRRRVVAAVAAILAASTAAALAAPATAPASSQQCSTTKAVAFRSDGQVPAASSVPSTCIGYTGWGGDESHIRVAPNGTVVQLPGLVPLGLPSYMQAGLTLTRDRGRSWQLFTPSKTFQPNDNAIYIDRKSGRLYLVLTVGFGVSLAGETQLLSAPATTRGYGPWSVTTMHGFIGAENSRFTSAVAPRGQRRAVGGQDVGYWCGNQNPVGTSPPILARTCYRSLDGGATWERGALLFTTGLPRHRQCGRNTESFSAGDGNYPQGAPNGALWVMVECGGVTYLARSTDEAATFPILHRANGAPVTIPFSRTPSGNGFVAVTAKHELRVDSRGNLYAFEVNDAAMLMRISRNGGLSWSTPVNLTAPAARHATMYQWQVAVGGPGQVAASYLSPRSSGGWDGYLSITRDALATSPSLFAAKVNPGSAPMASVGGVGDDFIDVDVGPDGAAWAAFWADCPTNAYEKFCAASKAKPVPENLQDNEQTGPQAEVVAHLSWPAP